METNNSVYKLLCRLFEALDGQRNSIVNDLNEKGIRNTLNQSKLARRKAKSKCNGFETLFSAVNSENDSSSALSKIYAHIYKLRRRGFCDTAESIEVLIAKLDGEEELHEMSDTIQVLKLFTFLMSFNEKSYPTSTQIELKQLSNISDQTGHWRNKQNVHSSLNPILYKTFQASLFEAERIQFSKMGPYTSSIITKLKSWPEMESLDKAHNKLFGAITNPPKSLNYLGISAKSSFQLSFNEIGKHGIRELRIPSTFTPEDEGYVSTNSSPLQVQHMFMENLEPNEKNLWGNLEELCATLPQQRTWEASSQGNIYPIPEPPYLTEAPLTVMRQVFREWENNLCLVDENFSKRNVIIVKEDHFRRDLLHLTLGIESKIFVYNTSEAQFQTSGFYSIDGLTIDCLTQILEPFLDCGKVVRQLFEIQYRVLSGSVYNSFIEEVGQFLKFHQLIMEDLFKTNKSLISLHFKLKTLFGPLNLLGKVSKWTYNHPGRGIVFLQRLLHESALTVVDEERRLLTAIFCACVRPFLTYLENWLFKGECCDPYEEFIIESTSGVLCQRDRSYWMEGFKLRDVKRPEVMLDTGEEEALWDLFGDIYVCGKSVHLLRLCQSKDEVFNERLSLEIALSLSQLREVFCSCEQYARRWVTDKIVYLQDTTNLTKVAERQRGITLARLEEKQLAKKMSDAATKHLRQADYKTELDRQLEVRKKELQKKIEQDLVEDQKIQIYVEEKEKKVMLEKERLLKQYAELMKDDSKTIIEDNLNANETKGTDIENNEVQCGPTIVSSLTDSSIATLGNPIPIAINTVNNALDLSANEFNLSAKPDIPYVGENVSSLENETSAEKRITRSGHSSAYEANNRVCSSQVKPADLTSCIIADKQSLSSQVVIDSSPTSDQKVQIGPSVKVRSRTHDSKKIKEQILLEEYDIAIRYEEDKGLTNVLNFESNRKIAETVHDSEDRPDEKTLTVGNISKLSVQSYTSTVNFSSQPFSALARKPDWLKRAKADDGEIRDFSLSYFVHRSLVIPLRTQCQLINQCLLRYFIQEQKLMKHLETLRDFLFLNNGTFGLCLVNDIGSRLIRANNVVQLVNIPTMNFILQNAINASRANETYAANLSFYIKDMSTQSRVDTLEVLDSFSLRYRVHWPHNLILTESIMDDYSQIFSFLLHLRLASWALQDAYILLSHVSFENLSLQLTRHAMQHFVQALQNYVMSQLLNLTWKEMIDDFEKHAQSLDDLYNIHLRYVYNAKSRLLLTSKCASLLKIVRDALNLTFKFRTLLSDVGNFQDLSSVQPRIKVLAAKFHEYIKFLNIVLVKVQERSHQSHLNELLISLNFNGYYDIGL